MKALFINGSPRKNWNTHKAIESAMNAAHKALELKQNSFIYTICSSKDV